MNYYRAYGWTIASTIELPTLASIEHQHIAAQLAQATLDQSLIELKIISTELWDEKQFAALTKEAPSAEWPDKPSQAQIWSFKQGAKMLFRYGERLEIGLIGQQFYVPERFHSEPLLPLLFSGNILSALSLYRGEPTLHASCVVKAGQAIAFAGPSGSGKTTLAASVLGSSWSLLTDDVLRFNKSSWLSDIEPPTVYQGSQLLRIRENSKDYVDPKRNTEKISPDARLLYAAEAPLAEDLYPLRYIIFPRPISSQAVSSQEKQLIKLQGVSAIQRVLSATQLDYVTDPSLKEAQFRFASKLSRNITCLELLIDWESLKDLRGRAALTDFLERELLQ